MSGLESRSQNQGGMDSGLIYVTGLKMHPSPFWSLNKNQNLIFNVWNLLSKSWKPINIPPNRDVNGSRILRLSGDSDSLKIKSRYLYRP